jgi:WD40 repeat protein
VNRKSISALATESYNDESLTRRMHHPGRDCFAPTLFVEYHFQVTAMPQNDEDLARVSGGETPRTPNGAPAAAARTTPMRCSSVGRTVKRSIPIIAIGLLAAVIAVAWPFRSGLQLSALRDEERKQGDWRVTTPFQSGLQTSALHDEERKQGDWRVTTLGKVGLTKDFEKQDRLLIGCEETAPELWDTVSGMRVAVLSQHLGALAGADQSPDGKKFVTANLVSGFNFLNGLNQGMTSRSIWVWETATGRFLKRIDVDLSAEGVRESTHGEISWRSDRELLLQLHRRYRGGASNQTVLGVIDLEKGKLTRLSKPIEIVGNLVLSPDQKRAIGALRIDDSRDSGGRGAHRVEALVDLQNFLVVATFDDANLDVTATLPSKLTVFWSPDSRRVATVFSPPDSRRADTPDRLPTVDVWNGLTGRRVSRLEGHSDRIVSVCFSPDGEKVLTASSDETGRVWEANTGQLIATLTGHTAALAAAAFDEGGQKAVTGGEDQTARLWDARTGKLLRTYAEHETDVRRVAFAANGDRIYTRTTRGVERYWSVKDGSLVTEQKLPRVLRGDPFEKFGACFLKREVDTTEVWVGPPGSSPPADPQCRVIIGGAFLDGDDLNMADVATPRLRLSTHGSVERVALSGDDKMVATLDEDTLVVWRPAEWNRVTGQGRLIVSRGLKSWSPTFSPDDRLLATGHNDGTVRLWDPGTGKLLKSRTVHRGSVSFVEFMADGKSLVSAAFDVDAKRFVVKNWDLDGVREHVVAEGRISGTTSAAVAPDGRQLAMGFPIDDNDLNPSLPWEVKVWDVSSSKQLHRLRGHTARVAALSFTPDSKRLISGGADKTVRIWNASNGKELVSLDAHSNNSPLSSDIVSSLACSPIGSLLATGDWNGTVKIWDIATMIECTTFKAHPTLCHVTALVFSRDGKTLVSGASDGTVKFWDVSKLLGEPGRK